MLIGIGGDLGAGKTLTLTYLGLRYLIEEDRTIYSNYHLNFPHKRLYAIRQLNEIRDGVFLADELWTWLDSRTSQKAANKGSTLLLAKSRKKNLDVVWTAQLLGSLDKRPRRMTQKFIYTELLPNPDTPKWCRCYITDRHTRPMGTFMFKADKIFPLYDTNEEIDPPAEFYEDIIRERTKKNYKLSEQEYFSITSGDIDLEDLVSDLE